MFGKAAFHQIPSSYHVLALYQGCHIGRQSPEILKTPCASKLYVHGKPVAYLWVGLVLFLHPAFQIVDTLNEQPE